MPLTDEQKKAIMRRFVTSAPPGQLPTVLRALKAMVGDNTLFFNVAPSLACDCLTTRHVAVNFPAASTGAAVHDAADAADAEVTPVVVSKANHAPQFAALLPTALNVALAEKQLGAEPFARFVFVDWAALRLCVVDPVTSTPVAAIPVTALSYFADPAANDLGAAHLNASPLALPASLVRASGAPVTDGMRRAALSLLFRPLLAAAMQRVADARYEDARAFVGVHVDKVPSGCGWSVGMCAERVNDAAAWSGRWTSNLTVHLSNPATLWAAGDEDAGDGALPPAVVTVRGQTDASFHYHEEGNIQMEASDDVSVDVAVADSATTAVNLDADVLVAAAERAVRAAGDARTVAAAVAEAGFAAGTASEAALAALARRVARQVERAEDAFQRSVTDACGPTLADESMRQLRRKLPVTKQLFDFTADRASTRTAFMQPPPKAAQ